MPSPHASLCEYVFPSLPSGLSLEACQDSIAAAPSSSCHSSSSTGQMATLWRYGLRVGSATRPRDRDDEQQAERRREAERLGFRVWPLPPRNTGRPTKQRRWWEALADAINRGESQSIESGVRPAWWNPGMGFEMPAEILEAAHDAVPAADEAATVPAAAAADEAATVPAAEEAATVPAAEEAATVPAAEGSRKRPRSLGKGKGKGKGGKGKKARKKKTNVPAGARSWFLRWWSHMYEVHGWSLSACLTLAGRWMPELGFASIDPSTPRRWREEEVEEEARGRPGVVPGQVAQDTCVMVYDLLRRGLPVTRKLVQQILRRKGVEVSESTTRRLMRHEMKLGYKVTGGSTAAKHSVQEQEAICDLMKAKLAWMQREWSVPNDHVWNLDQTGVRLTPGPGRSWHLRGSQSAKQVQQQVNASKEQITVALMVRMTGGDLLAQCIFAGKTDAVLPMGPHPPFLHVTSSESHWSTVATMLQAFGAIVAQHEPDSHIICVVDCAPVHCSAEMNEEVKIAYPNLHLLFLYPGCTAYCQPLDRSYMRAWKANLADQATADYCDQVMDTDAVGRIKTSKPRLRLAITSMVARATLAVGSGTTLHLTAWRRMRCWTPQQVIDSLQHADALHRHGQLFEPDWESLQRLATPADAEPPADVESEASEEEEEEEEEAGRGARSSSRSSSGGANSRSQRGGPASCT